MISNPCQSTLYLVWYSTSLPERNGSNACRATAAVMAHTKLCHMVLSGK